MLLVSAPADAQSTACVRNQSWEAFVRCAFPRQRVEVAQEFANGKLVKFVSSARADVASLGFYVRRDGAWSQIGFHASIGPSNELLAAQEIAPDTYRIDIGFAGAQFVTLDQIGTRPALIRRRFTYVCPQTRGCQHVVTRCEVLVHGKMIGGYRGDVVWNGSGVVLRADVSAQNRYCMPPRHVLVEEPDA
jgi:hypothetical protein